MLRGSAVPATFGVALATVLLAACAGTEKEGYALHARGGTYVDGTGRLGLAVLMTLRDPDGTGPAADWTGSLVGPAGSVGGGLTYGAQGAGSWAATWWPDEPAYTGTYSVELAPVAGGALGAGFQVDDGAGMAPPRPIVAEDGASISWGPVTGAMSYECRVADGAVTLLRRVVTTPGCDLGDLPPGAFSASVLAFSADLAAIAANGSRDPALPARFDVSEARVALSRPDVAPPPATLAVAAGGFSDGTGWTGRGLAIWISLLNGDGTPTNRTWSIEVVGPGLTAAAPLQFAYPANFSRIMIWSAEVPATPGSYGVIARAGDANLARTFALGALGTLGAPTAVAATAGSQGSADVTWSGVDGAVSYLVTARHRATGANAMSQWVAGTTARFPAGTLVVGETYDVFVAATDADMVAGVVPAPFVITENTYEPASFAAR